MMKKLGLTLALLAVAVLLLFIFPSQETNGQADDIEIEGADAIVTREISGSLTLRTLIDRVEPRFVLEYADAFFWREIEPVPTDLETLIGQVADRFTLERADASRQVQLAYPCGLLSEPDDPVISELQVTGLRTDQATISWLTDEYTDALLVYGLDPGTYSWTAYDAQWANAHFFTLTGLTEGSEYYYRVSSTDRCANTATSEEYSFRTLGDFIYLPLILREY